MARGVTDIERHRDDVFADIEMVLEALRPFVLGIPGPPDLPEPNRDHLNPFRNMIDAKVKLLGLNAPKQAHVAHEDGGPGEPSEETALFLARLNVWMRQTHTFDEKTGWLAQPVLPPGLTERVNVSGTETIKSQVELSPPGRSMWSLVLEFPALEV